MKNSKNFTRKDIEHYLQEKHGKSVDDFFGDSYYRYTEEGSDQLQSCFTHFSGGWKRGSKGLTLEHPTEEGVFMVHPKIKGVNDLSNLDAYLEKINEFREGSVIREFMVKMGLEAVKEKAGQDDLESNLHTFLKEQHDSDLDDVLSEKEPKRSRLMNEILREFAQAHINKDNNVVVMDPAGEEHQRTDSGKFALSKIQDKDHFLQLVKGSKENRDLTFFIASPHVRQNKPVTREAVISMTVDRTDMSIDDIISGKGISKEERTKILDSVHFYFSEVSRDKEGDMTFSLPDNERKTVCLNHTDNNATYYSDISTLDQFIEKIQYARNGRDAYYAEHEQVKEKAEKRMASILKNKERGDDELER